MSITISGSDHRQAHPRAAGRPASVDLEPEDRAFVNWSNGNAATLFDLLGLRGARADVDSDFTGEVSVAEARRAVIRARATLQRRGPALTRPEVAVYGAPRTLPDGVVELRPLRLWSAGLDVDDMRVRLHAFERCVNALALRGATHITWD
jgi:hypothetical protein